MQYSRKDRTVSSALWAAYGDILGFPTELVDESGVKRRIGQAESTYPLPWKRLVGGRTGVWVDLEAGSYSDDTQLRLATCRSIRADGYFDVEAFAKIELPVWLSYCLGAGRGSKVGAAALSQRNANWFSNFFEQRDVVYTAGGGNGAAMRIQPHVWAAQDLGNPATYLPEVIQNSLCTHGHPRGIAGAVIHAVCLAHVLKNGEVPPPVDWKIFGSFVTVATDYIENNADLSTFWLPTWNSRTGSQFAEEMEKARMEWEADVIVCQQIIEKFGNRAYREIVNALGGTSAAQRGSGIKSALFSLTAAWLYKDVGPNAALIRVANFLDSDTDTIATMAGALLGALCPQHAPSGPIMDVGYITSEASRLHDVGEDSCVESFSYPDLMTWQPPRNQVDVVGLVGNRLAVAGLGYAVPKSEEYVRNQSDSSWQWLELSFGQTVLCKRRVSLVELGNFSIPIVHPMNSVKALKSEKNELVHRSKSDDLFATSDRTHWRSELQMGSDTLLKPIRKVALRQQDQAVSAHRTLDVSTDDAIRSGFDPAIIGRDLMALAEVPNGIERAIAYVAVVIKAKQARLKRKAD